MCNGLKNVLGGIDASAYRPLVTQVNVAKMTCKHLTHGERYWIEMLLKAEHKQNAMICLCAPCQDGSDFSSSTN